MSTNHLHKQNMSPLVVTPQQLAVLSLLPDEISPSELNELKMLISRFFLEKMADFVTERYDQLGVTNDDLEKLLNDENQ